MKGTNISEPGIPEAFKVLLKELQSLALDMKVLTENKEELSLKDLMESDYDDVPAFREKENREEVSLEDFAKDEVGEGAAEFADDEDVDLDDEFDFNKDMFEDDDEEIDTTVPDGDYLDDDFDDEDGDNE